jgi:hypothetical protein
MATRSVAKPSSSKCSTSIVASVGASKRSSALASFGACHVQSS